MILFWVICTSGPPYSGVISTWCHHTSKISLWIQRSWGHAGVSRRELLHAASKLHEWIPSFETSERWWVDGTYHSLALQLLPIPAIMLSHWTAGSSAADRVCRWQVLLSSSSQASPWLSASDLQQAEEQNCRLPLNSLLQLCYLSCHMVTSVWFTFAAFVVEELPFLKNAVFLEIHSKSNIYSMRGRSCQEEGLSAGFREPMPPPPPRSAFKAHLSASMSPPTAPISAVSSCLHF